MIIGPLRPTYSKHAQHPDHKRKNQPLPPTPEPKRIEEHTVPTVKDTPINDMSPVHDLRVECNNDILCKETPPLFNPVPASPPIDEKYLLLLMGCAIIYLWRTHGPEISFTTF